MSTPQPAPDLPEPVEPKKNGASTGVTLRSTLIYCGLPVLLLFAFFLYLGNLKERLPPSHRTTTFNHLRQILIALHAYHDIHKHLPTSAIRDNAGRPLLSWRVAILPFIEEEALYKRFKLDEPWDSPHNIKLLKQMPPLYRLNYQQEEPVTYFQVFIGPGTAFERNGRPLSLQKDFPDGIENTILIVVADKPVPWTKPEDVPFHPEGTIAITGEGLKKLNVSPGLFLGFGDAAVRRVEVGLDDVHLRRAIIRNDGHGAMELLK